MKCYLTLNESKLRIYPDDESRGNYPCPLMLRKIVITHVPIVIYKRQLTISLKYKMNIIDDYSVGIKLTNEWTSGNYACPINYVPTHVI